MEVGSSVFRTTPSIMTPHVQAYIMDPRINKCHDGWRVVSRTGRMSIHVTKPIVFFASFIHYGHFTPIRYHGRKSISSKGFVRRASYAKPSAIFARLRSPTFPLFLECLKSPDPSTSTLSISAAGKGPTGDSLRRPPNPGLCPQVSHSTLISVKFNSG